MTDQMSLWGPDDITPGKGDDHARPERSSSVFSGWQRYAYRGIGWMRRRVFLVLAARFCGARPGDDRATTAADSPRKRAR